MTQLALACVVCGRVLHNIHDEVENQPDGGIAFSSPGHYGSTIFDPFDGTHIEISLCDPCLVEAGERGRVLSGRRSRPVRLERDMIIGYEELDTPLVEWHRGMPGYDDFCELSLEDFETGAEPLPETICIDPKSLDAARRLIVSDGG